MNEVKGQFNDVLIVSELRGGFPSIKIPDDVDQAGLTAGDDEPFFLTLPIGKAGVTSGNQRHYDEAWLTELEKQTVANKPVGLMGHLSTADRAHAFPAEAIHWLAVLREGDTLWGKGYVPPGEARKRIQRYRAQNKKIATSIDAEADGAWDEAIKAFRMDARTLKLGQIDIAPADRAGIASLAAVPFVTSEMTPTEPVIEQEPVMDKLEIINGMTAEDARLLPKAVRDAILAEQAAPPEVAEVQELRQALGVDDKADLPKLVTEMKQAQETQRLATVKTRIRELASDAEKGIKIVPVRTIVIEMVEALEPSTIEEAEAKYNMVATSGPITELLKDRVVQTMGPRQGTPVASQQGQAKYFPIPAEKQEAN